LRLEYKKIKEIHLEGESIARASTRKRMIGRDVSNEHLWTDVWFPITIDVHACF